jgi:hypothetical protein
MPNVLLDQQDIDAMMAISLHKHAQELREKFPRFDKFPPSAQMALLDMQYNLGGYKFRDYYFDKDGIQQGWPKLFKAVKEGDWETAAWESHRTGIQKERNDSIRKLLAESRKK